MQHDPSPASEPDTTASPEERHERALYVINLGSSATPMALEIPAAEELIGLAVFRSTTHEEGRDRYRMHLGYFDSLLHAERVLPTVHRYFPAAWIAIAPAGGLGSLDDTTVSDFRLVRAPRSGTDSASTTGAAELKNVVPGAASKVQRFAIQLMWSAQRANPDEIPPLSIFGAYTLYTVTLMRRGVRLYGIRLGFFTSALSARQVALYLRREFPAVTVVPISDREYDRARELVWLRDSRIPRLTEEKPADEPAAIPDNKGAAATRDIQPTPVDAAPVAQPVALTESPAPTVPPPTDMPAQRLSTAATMAFSREEVMAALGGSELALGAPADASRSGTRTHLHGRRSTLGRLLHRLAERFD